MAQVTRSTCTADRWFRGRAKDAKYESNKYGIEIPAIQFDDLGAIATSTATGLVVQRYATIASAPSFTMSGTLVAAGVGTFDVGRAPKITATATITGVTFTFNGTDDLGRAMRQSFTGPSGNTYGNAGSITTGLVAMKTITSITQDAAWATTILVDIGSSDSIGFKFRLADKGKVQSVSQDGKPESTLTLVAGLAAATVPTATTVDGRGLWTPNTAPDGTKRWNAVYKMDTTEDALAFGRQPFAG